MMEHTKLHLKTWLLAIHFVIQAKTGILSLAGKRSLGVCYPTAWLQHHKINNAMPQQEPAPRLGGAVQLDGACFDGECSGGKVGQGSENKVPFVAAAPLNVEGLPMHLKLDPVSGFSADAIAKGAKANLPPIATVLSEGLACLAAVTAASCIHTPRVVGALKPRDLSEFKWVTLLENLDAELAGAFKALKFGKYAKTYLAAFARRFNH
ncbi:IS1595 family transposase [Ideonella paludis]|uniref:IS1595 family transposase n=1 Tax=Ideonella paludis TaxID=1233411 RepID=A0ABS5E333_9BURK|nr:IS1595 family transposase [Ideonella paludis]MBQ0937798.1 IS1595 family transposase [Ideonella paludis]